MSRYTLKRLSRNHSLCFIATRLNIAFVRTQECPGQRYRSPTPSSNVIKSAALHSHSCNQRLNRQTKKRHTFFRHFVPGTVFFLPAHNLPLLLTKSGSFQKKWYRFTRWRRLLKDPLAASRCLAITGVQAAEVAALDAFVP